MYVSDRPLLLGLELRYAVVVALVASGRTMTVAELGSTIEAWGFTVEGRRSKVVSDALRWEVRRGRIERVGRGRYRRGRVAPSSLHRMRRRIDARRTAIRHRRRPDDSTPLDATA